MKIPTKEEYFKKLRSDKDYQSLLKAAPSDERQRIINTVETVMSSMFEAFSLMASNAKGDPNIAKEVTEALKTGVGIIKESDGSPIAPEKKEK
jgi:hypothetical protein